MNKIVVQHLKSLEHKKRDEEVKRLQRAVSLLLARRGYMYEGEIRYIERNELWKDSDEMYAAVLD